MPDFDSAINELRLLDDISGKDSFIHRIHPVAKLITTIIYILITMSFDKYSLSGLMAMFLYPIFVFSSSGLSMKNGLYKLRYVLPLICLVGIFNPFFDKESLFNIGMISVSGGTMSMLTMVAKGVLCLLSSYAFVATTAMDSCCAGLRRLGVPNLIVALFLMTYRYVFVLIDELSNMLIAYRLRAPEHKGIHISAWGSFLGQLLIRSMDRAEELYNSMELRGFEGDFRYAGCRRLERSDILYMLILIATFVMARYINIARVIGGLFV